MTGEHDADFSGEASDPAAAALRQELAHNVVEPADLPPGYQLEGPGEPGADADIPGVLGGPGITISPEAEHEPGS
jgi:hypothetical protein